MMELDHRRAVDEGGTTRTLGGDRLGDKSGEVIPAVVRWVLTRKQKRGSQTTPLDLPREERMGPKRKGRGKKYSVKLERRRYRNWIARTRNIATLGINKGNRNWRESFVGGTGEF